MTLNVPLAVTIGTTRITREVASLGFRRDAVGGIQSLSLRLSRPLSQIDQTIRLWQPVTIYDTRTAEVVATGRIADIGRTAGPDGQQHEVVCFGPAQHAWDRAAPYVVIDQSLTDGWRQVNRPTLAGATVSQSTKPGVSTDGAAECIVMHFPQDKFVDPDDELTMRYETLREAGMVLARVSYEWDAGVTESTFSVESVARTDGGTGNTADSSTFNLAGGSHSSVVVTDWTNGRNTLDLRAIFRAGLAFAPSTDKYWASFTDIYIRSRLMNEDGTDKTSGYTTNYVLAHAVVQDLLGRFLDQYDGANAVIDTSAAHQIDAMVYPDGVAPGDVLEDLMRLEPAHRWYVDNDGATFRWEPWPTTVRYEITLDDGASLPLTGQELFNQVTVRWRDKRGRVRTTLRTGACPLLDDEGLTRRAWLDVGDEIASNANADRLGDNFLARHNVPLNAGTLAVARPVRDLTTGRMVRPHEIDPGTLVRVKGVEAYPDALNASSNDGQTVYRIWSNTYASDSDTATLELDTYSRQTALRLGLLTRKRGRKR